MQRLLAYLQLLRLPNVFTAMADVFAGFLVSRGSLQPWREFVPLLVASSCIYLAGMVWNDWFDIEVDRRERPHRPLPSGRVARHHALVLGVGLLAVGVVAAMLASDTSRNVAIVLVACVLLYDGLVKATFLGPFVMGLCRTLNVLLGMSSEAGAIWLMPDAPTARFGTMVAAGLGLYVMGVTRFASREADQSPRLDVPSTTLGLNLGLLLVAMAGQSQFVDEWLIQRGLPLRESPALNYYSAAAIWLSVLVAANAMTWRAIADPKPEKLQPAVKTCIVAIIGIDAAAVALVNGPVWAAAVLLLLVPTLTLGRWVYST